MGFVSEEVALLGFSRRGLERSEDTLATPNLPVAWLLLSTAAITCSFLSGSGRLCIIDGGHRVLILNTKRRIIKASQKLGFMNSWSHLMWLREQSDSQIETS